MRSSSSPPQLRRWRARFGGWPLLAMALALPGAGCAAGGAGTGAHASAGSAPAAAPMSSAAPEHIWAVYQSHCGSCHRPVRPGTEPPDRLDAELRLHRKRTRLTDQEWAGLGALLAARR